MFVDDSFRTPPLRESFSFPFHIVQLFVLTYVLRQQQSLMNSNALKSLIGYQKKSDQSIPVNSQTDSLSRRQKTLLIFLLSGSTILYMLPWQCKFFE